MEQSKKYFSHAWGDLTSDKKWWQPVLILSLVSCIPVVGWIVVIGYFYDWAKEGAWGLKTSLPREVGNLGKRFKYGWFAIVICFVWMAPCALAAWLLGMIPFTGDLLKFIFQVVEAIAGVIAGAAVVRALIYDRIVPGLQIKRILAMSGKDAGGLLRIFCIELIGFLLAAAVVIVCLLPFIPIVLMGVSFAGSGYSMGMSSGMGSSMGSGMGMGLLGILATVGIVAVFVLIVAAFVATIIIVLFTALATRAYGYWVAEFQPARWGKAADPMPFETEEQEQPATPTPPAGANVLEPPAQAAPEQSAAAETAPEESAAEAEPAAEESAPEAEPAAEADKPAEAEQPEEHKPADDTSDAE